MRNGHAGTALWDPEEDACMKKQYLILGLAPVLALAACGGNNTTNTATADNMTDTEMSGDANVTDNGADNALVTDEAATPSQKFANDVGASDYYEIEAGKLAQDKATSQALKDFGKMMVTAHTDSTGKLKAAGAKASPAIAPNPVLNAEQEANLAALRAADGADFDAAYKTQQIAAHEKALSAMKDYAANGEVAPLKQFARDTVKVVETHLAKIRAL
jgi:putative membrane protein